MESISKETEAALLREYQNGNQNVFDRIFQQFEPLAMSRVRKIIANDCEHLRAELESEAKEALWRAADTFDLERDCRFSTYATKYIDTAILSMMSEQRKRLKRTKKYFQQSPVECVVGGGSDYEVEIVSTDQFPCRDESILPELTPFCNPTEHKIINMICNDEDIWHKNGNLNNASIARKQGISREAVRKALKNLRSNRHLKSRLQSLVN